MTDNEQALRALVAKWRGEAAKYAEWKNLEAGENIVAFTTFFLSWQTLNEHANELEALLPVHADAE